MTGRRKRTERRDLYAARENERIMRPVIKTRRVRAVGSFEKRVLDALVDYGEPVTSSQLAHVLGDSHVLVARALGTLRFNRLATFDRVGKHNRWSPC